MTAERNMGNPNSSSNYPAYEAASLDGVARSKCFYIWSFDYFLRRLTGKQMLVVHGARDSLIPISHSMALARVRNILHFGIDCWKSTSMERSELLWARYRKSIVCPNQNLQYQTPPSPEMQMKLINLDNFCSAWRKQYISGANCAKHSLPATGAVTQF